jgi:hypothetical protein
MDIVTWGIFSLIIEHSTIINVTNQWHMKCTFLYEVDIVKEYKN